MVHAVVARSRQAGPSQRVDPPVNPIPIESPCRRTSRRAARQSKHRDARPPLDRAAISWADSAMCRLGASGRAPAVGKDAGAPGLGEESCGTGEVGLSTSRPAGRLVCSGSVQARCLSVGEATERGSLPVSSLPHLVHLKVTSRSANVLLSSLGRQPTFMAAAAFVLLADELDPSAVDRWLDVMAIGRARCCIAGSNRRGATLERYRLFPTPAEPQYSL